MSDFKKLSLRECADRLLAVEKPLVLMHIRPDGDTVGSAAALMETFRELGKEPRYALADEIPERLAFLVEGFSRATDFEGLTPVGIDIPSPMQLGDLYGRLDVLFTIDHHEVNTPFSDNCTVGSASSAGEVLLDVLRVLVADGKIKLTKKIAERDPVNATTSRRASVMLLLFPDASISVLRIFDAQSITRLSLRSTLVRARVKIPIASTIVASTTKNITARICVSA